VVKRGCHSAFGNDDVRIAAWAGGAVFNPVALGFGGAKTHALYAKTADEKRSRSLYRPG
jgi:hypothetical protein